MDWMWLSLEVVLGSRIPSLFATANSRSGWNMEQRVRIRNLSDLGFAHRFIPSVIRPSRC